MIGFKNFFFRKIGGLFYLEYQKFSFILKICTFGSQFQSGEFDFIADEQVRVQEASLAQLEDLLKQAESRFRQQTVAEFDVVSSAELVVTMPTTVSSASPT